MVMPREGGYASGLDQLALDPVVERWLAARLSAARRSELEHLNRTISADALEVARHVDRDAPPRLVAHDLDGNRIDRAQLAPTHVALLERLRPMVALATTEPDGLLAALAAGYLLADPGLYCTITLTTQVSLALADLAPHHSATARLREGPWFGATWFTETHAGSDLGSLRARATQTPNGEWRIGTAEKFFASNAGLADVALVAAHVGEVRGVRSLGLFLVRREQPDGSLAFSVRRLKDKLATRAVPTGEVDLADAPAELLAAPPDGIHRILESLTIARVANAMSAAGIARIALAEATIRGQRRVAFGRPLLAHALFADELARLRASQLATSLLAFELAEETQSSLGSHHGDRAYQILRARSHVAKVRTAEQAAFVTQRAMEAFGGLGFVEDAPIARWHREALVLPIWEGTPHVHALDAAEVLADRVVRDGFVERITAALDGSVGKRLGDAVRRTAAELAEAPTNARHLLTHLGALSEAAAVARLDLPGIDQEPLAAWLCDRALEGEPSSPPPLGDIPPLKLDAID